MAIATGVLALGAELAPVRATDLPIVAPARRADVTFHKVRVWSFRDSALSGVGSAESLAYDRSAGRGTAEAAFATMPGRGADPRPVDISAGIAEGRVGTRAVDARSGVVLSRIDGTVHTASARFDGRAHLIAGAEPVALASGNARVAGQAFTLDTVSEQIELVGPVKAHTEGAP